MKGLPWAGGFYSGVRRGWSGERDGWLWWDRVNSGLQEIVRFLLLQVKTAKDGVRTRVVIHALEEERTL